MTAAQVLIWDPIQGLDWSYDIEQKGLAEHGVELVVPDRETADDEQLARADVLVVSGPFPSHLLGRLDNCVGIICYSVGMDAVDASAAAAASIPVTNVAGYCTHEVSEHAMALLLALQRRLLSFARRAGRGEWDVYSGKDFFGIRRVHGQTLGIVGLGRIGTQVAAKASAFGMRVIAFDPYLSVAPQEFVRLVDLDTLLADSDAVVLCSALTDSSRQLLDAHRIASMRQGAVLVNVARGGLVDETALVAALATGHLSGAALDVREQEPPADDDPLRTADNVVLTQHMGATSQEARIDLHLMAVQRAVALLVDSGRLPQGNAS